MIRRAGLLSLLGIVLVCGSSRAALDPEVKTPYQLKIVLRVAPHRLLTQVFKDQLKRELRDSLQAALGRTGEVKVLDDPEKLAALFKDLDEKGLQAVLDGMEKDKPPSGAGKMHFVLVDFVNGQYVVQAGQYDGLTGLATPLVRRAHTDDRQFVAKLAALLVERDMGIVGTVTGRDPQKVTVVFKGSQLGTPIDRWVKKDSVFAIAKVSRAAPGGSRVPEAYLQALEAPKNGVCECRLVRRYADADSRLEGGALGYRCIKLGTGEGPLRLRLVNDQGLPLADLGIKISSKGFDDSDSFKPQGMTRTEGLVQSDEKYHDLAFVRVESQRERIAQFAVPVYPDRVAVIRVRPVAQGEMVGELRSRNRRLMERLVETNDMVDDLRKTLRDHLAKSQQEQALAEARKGLQSLQGAIKELDADATTLLADVTNLPDKKTRPNTAEVKKRLAALRDADQEVQKFITDLDDILTKQKADTSKKDLLTLVQRARLLKNQGDYDEALKVYEEALVKVPDQPQVKKEYEELKAAWVVKSDEHGKARKFVYEVWPNQDTPQKMKAQMPAARAAFKVLKDKGDKLTANRLALANVKLDDRLQKLLSKLDVTRSEDDRRTAEIIKEVGLALEDFHAEVVEFLGLRKQPAPKEDAK